MQNKNFKISFKRKYSISDLKKYLQAQRDKIEKNLHLQCKILIIDDVINETDYLFKDDIVWLKNQKNCNITTKTDLENLADAGGYDIIISDNEGVGIHLGGQTGNGILLINQLKKEYPDKIYVLFSSKQTNFRQIKRLKANEIWDKTELLQNSRENREGGFADKVQEMMKYFANPSKRWEDVRTQLLNSGTSIHSVAKLESAYVKSIINKQPEIYSKTYDKTDVTNDKNIDVSDLIKSGKSFINTTISLLSLI
ncbi:MAG: hypothetical protein LBC98_04250 [Prevotellaceae bacterium]|jgi:hypothetical protein|nr:hypothetical protein [Prevotellaceae bacterium]